MAVEKASAALIQPLIAESQDLGITLVFQLFSCSLVAVASVVNQSINSALAVPNCGKLLGAVAGF